MADVAAPRALVQGIFPRLAWQRLQRLLRRPSQYDTEHLSGAELTERISVVLAAAYAGPWVGTVAMLGGLVEWLDGIAQAHEQRAAEARRRDFIAWARKELHRAPSKLHAFTKPRGWTHVQIDTPEGPTSDAQAVAEQQMDAWATLWEARPAPSAEDENAPPCPHGR